MGRDLGPAPSLVTPETLANFKTITLEEYIDGYLASKINGKSIWFYILYEIRGYGIYWSIEHRATVNSEKERLSIARFHNIQIGRDLGSAPSLVTPETLAMFKIITLEEYIDGYLASKINRKSYLDAVRIKHEIHE
ncbi:hypothetical protein KIW84_022763 [Lathyrus oleraceus]|uniref:Uncharacterized protein n=1 Tax=Pisum sativum TaxID=3888 RepID=A0A9D5B5Q2_PEA|nr:hypothetical protein KIW84_022763 [Pisum sativum]